MLDLIIDSGRPKKGTATGKTADNQADRPVVSLVKTISWRVVGTIDTIVISYVITGEVKSAVSIGGIEVFSKMILYYFHERLWAKIKRNALKK